MAHDPIPPVPTGGSSPPDPTIGQVRARSHHQERAKTLIFLPRLARAASRGRSRASRSGVGSRADRYGPVEAGAVALVAGDGVAGHLDLEEDRVLVAVDPHLPDCKRVAALLALPPELLAASGSRTRPSRSRWCGRGPPRSCARPSAPRRVAASAAIATISPSASNFGAKSAPSLDRVVVAARGEAGGGGGHRRQAESGRSS